MTFEVPSPIASIPGKVTNKTLNQQGWNAALAGFKISDCPYYSTSAAETHWKRGFRSVAA